MIIVIIVAIVVAIIAFFAYAWSTIPDDHGGWD